MTSSGPLFRVGVSFVTLGPRLNLSSLDNIYNKSDNTLTSKAAMM